MAKIDSKKYDATCMGNNDLGSVYLHKPYGNNDSNIKIAI